MLRLPYDGLIALADRVKAQTSIALLLEGDSPEIERLFVNRGLSQTWNWRVSIYLLNWNTCSDFIALSQLGTTFSVKVYYPTKRDIVFCPSLASAFVHANCRLHWVWRQSIFLSGQVLRTISTVIILTCISTFLGRRFSGECFQPSLECLETLGHRYGRLSVRLCCGKMLSVIVRVLLGVFICCWLISPRKLALFGRVYNTNILMSELEHLLGGYSLWLSDRASIPLPFGCFLVLSGFIVLESTNAVVNTMRCAPFCPLFNVRCWVGWVTRFAPYRTKQLLTLKFHCRVH